MDEVFQQDGADPDQALAGFALLVTAYKRALDAQEDIGPPPEPRAAHEEFLSAGRADTEVTQDLADRLAGAESLPDMLEVYGEFTEEGRASSERFGEACLSLQAIADDNGIDADLGCG